MPTPITPRSDLTAEQRAVLADARVSARFDELHAKALDQGPGRPGGCGQNPFWSWGFDGADLCVERLVSHAAYEVGLERRREELAAQAQRVAA